MNQPLATELRTRFLTAMSHAACTVNIVTTDGPAGRAGVTVSAMASVSADSALPTLLVCVHHLSPAAARIIENGVLCVNVLRDDQSYISDTFAGRFKDEVGDKFDCTEWVNCASGAPRIADPLVAFDCRLMSSERIGTHHVLLCEVQSTHISGTGSPLIYANRAYGTSNRIEGATSLGQAKGEQNSTLLVGCFHSFGPYMMPRLMRQLDGVSVRLIEGDHRRLRESLLSGECEIALLYDLDLDDNFTTTLLDEMTPYVLLPQGHPLADQAEIMPADLATEPMVLLDAPPSRDYFTGLLTQAGITPLIAHRTTSFEMARGMVGHGLGYTILVTKPAMSMTYDGMPLVTRPLIGNHPAVRIVLARRAGVDLSPAARRFAALCSAEFSA